MQICLRCALFITKILTSDKCVWVCQIDNDVIYIHDNNIAKVVFNNV